MKKYKITLEISIPEKYVDSNKAMFHITRIVSDEFPLGLFFPDCPWDEKKIECAIKDLNLN